nr:MAG TPA: hypothetical protein [Caudoviricetes sp.]
MSVATPFAFQQIIDYIIILLWMPTAGCANRLHTT